MKNYTFKTITHCEMCGDITDQHRILGQRLNKSQGLSPKKKYGIAVSIQKCKQCGLIYAQPQPIPQSIQDHYGTPPESYWKESYFSWDESYFARQIEQAKELVNPTTTMRALDVGAGIGKAMLSLNKAGFETFGFEPSEPFYKRAIEKMSIPADKLKLGMIEEVDYPANYFDFVTFGAVFEHLYSPAECLEKALRWTKKGGIVHIEVPSADWLVPKLVNTYFRLIGTNYVNNLSPMHSPFHLHEFTLCSFQTLAQKLHFTVEKHYYDVCSLYFIPKPLHPIFRAYMKKTDTGMQLTVYLRKK